MWEEHFGSNVVASLVAQYYGNGPVGAFLLNNPSVDRLQLVRIQVIIVNHLITPYQCCDVADGLAYLHDFDPMIIHGDLKGVGYVEACVFFCKIESHSVSLIQSNILVNDKHRAVICDFGLSSLKDSHATGFETSRRGGTLRFLAPELLDDNPTTTQSDVWAFACVCMEVRHFSHILIVNNWINLRLVLFMARSFTIDLHTRIFDLRAQFSQQSGPKSHLLNYQSSKLRATTPPNKTRYMQHHLI